MAKLVLFLADGSTLDIPLDRERITIGRRTGNEVCLPYPAVSGKHAVVVTLPTGSVIEDLGSTNGTFVNRKRIAKYFLHDRDTIDIGRQKLVYCTDNDAVFTPVTPLRSAARAEGQVARTASMLNPITPATRTDATSAAGDAAVHTNTTVRLASEEISESAIAAFAAAHDVGAGHDGTSAAESGDTALPNGPALRVLSGASMGRVLALNKDEVLVGRIGVQVAAVRRGDEGFRLLLMEGELPPQVNGVAVPAEGSLLKHGDVAEVAGVRLEFVDLPDTPEVESQDAQAV